MPHQRVRAAVAVVGVAALGAFLMSGNAAAAGGKRAVVPDVKPAWATSARATGTAPTSQSVSIRVGLKMRDQAGAEGLVRDLSDPSSPRYGHYLTPKAFTTRFAPTAASVDRVSSYLQSQGLKVTGVAQGNQWVNASGTVAQLNKAFATTLKTYSYRGKTLRAPESSVTVPAAIQADVSTVSGLSQRATHMTPQHVGVPSENTPKAKARSAGPTATPPPASQCSDYWGEYQQTVPKVDGKTRVNTYLCGYTAAQLRKIYGTAKTVAKGNDGHGVTVAIIDAYANPTMEADANRYFGLVGEPAFKAGQYSETTFTPFNDQDLCGGEDGWNGEEALDVEAVHGMAPGANIHYVGAQNCAEGIDVALNYVVQNHTADIVSNSYGDQGEVDLGDEVAIEHAIFLQAGAEGIGMYFSSGDSGDEVVNGLDPQPDYPASDTLVTAVGGTSELTNKKGASTITTGWETALDLVDFTGTKAQYSEPLPGFFWGGAGGGTSTLFTQPYYQRSAVPASLANRDGQRMRVVPDVSADADPYTGFYYAYTSGGDYVLDTIGGTSLATPLTAGIQAVAEQNRAFPIGFANPLIYSMRANAFNDVTPRAPLRFASVGGSYTGTFEAGDTQSSRYGYDDITGRGTPNGTTFLKAERH